MDLAHLGIEKSNLLGAMKKIDVKTIPAGVERLFRWLCLPVNKKMSIFCFQNR